LNDSFFEGFFKNTLWIAGIAIVIMIIMAALMGNRPATIVLMSAGMIAGSFGIAALLGIIYRFFTRK
jgi:cytochrome b561